MIKRNALFAVCAMGVIVLLSSVALNAQRKVDERVLNPKSKRMLAALRSGSASYFKSISFTEFNQANIVDDKGPSLISVFGFDGIPELLGGLTNSEMRVRWAIYEELQFHMDGNDIVGAMRANARWSRYPDMVAKALRVQIENEMDALLTLNETKRKYGVR
ncbi:MAG TPA: hypothetical protein PLG31_06380 [Spirochaetota bacterium]|nr:hypothetical protein [Spirochaetota bacterium]